MKVISQNKQATFLYHIIEKFDAGIVLIGQEVKSIKLGQINLKGSYVIVEGNDLYLVGCHIPPYQPKNIENYSPDRPRKLLLKRKELNYLIGKSRQGGLTLIPLKVYTSKALIKVEIGVAKGKKLVDKREGIKKREIDRNLKRSLKL